MADLIVNLPDRILKETKAFVMEQVEEIKRTFISKAVINDIKQDIWMAGVNFPSPNQGVWIRYKDVEKIIDKRVKEYEDYGRERADQKISRHGEPCHTSREGE